MDIIEVEKGYHQTEQVIEKLASEYDNQVTKISGKKVSNVLYLVGDTREIEQKKGYVKDLPGVLKILNITAPYKNIAKIVSKDGTVLHRDTHIVEVKGADGLVRRIGAGKHIFFVGPDSVQDWEQTISIAKACVELGKKYDILDRIIFRAGAYKPRTKPTDWRGLGWEGVELLDRMREETGLPYVTEIMDHTLADEVSKHADMLQIGTRNAQNFQLLEAVGQTKKPVILKRGFGNEASEWFSAAEYIANKGSLDIVLCERGVKTLFIKEGYCRNTPDLNVIPFVKKETILPVIFDPSHSSGKDQHIASNLLSSIPFEVDGTITETIHKEDYRKEQKCDAAQALLMSVYEKAVQAVLSYEENIKPFTNDISRHFDNLQQKLG